MLSATQRLNFYDSYPLNYARRSIRVLDLEPARSLSLSTAGVRLRGSLRVVSLAESPRFTALSYVWGSNLFGTHTIRCDGVDIPITKNCCDALKALRNRWSVVTIWVDAICINQNNEAEKSKQILLMGEIYSWAEKVYIWLGGSTKGSDAAVKWFRLLPNPHKCLWPISTVAAPTFSARAWEFCKKIVEVMGIILDIRPQGRRLKKLMKAYNPDDFDDLLGREWLQRVWTFQEIILACNPVLVCGGKRLAWDDFLRGLEFLVHIDESLQDPTLRMYPSRNSIWRYDWIRKISGNPATLASFRLPTQTANWRSIFILWMYVARETKWNERPFRRSFRSTTSNQRSSMSTPFSTYLSLANKRLPGIIVCSNISLVLVVILSMSLGIALPLILGGDKLPLAFSLGFFFIGVAIFFSSLVGMNRFGYQFAPFISPPGGIWSEAKIELLPGVKRAIRLRSATNPKDRSYAMYGVLKSLGVALTIPDYAKPLGQIYQELFLDILKWNGDLNVLLDGGYPQLPATPTWAPNWNVAADKGWLDPDYIYESSQKSASLASRGSFTFDGRAILRVNGCILGKVASCFAPLGHSELNLMSVLFYLRYFQQVRHRVRLFNVNDTMSTCVHETLYARTSSRVEARHRNSFNEWYQFMMLAVIQMDFDHSDMNSLAVQCLEEITRKPQVMWYHLGLCAKLAKERRTFFITFDGYLGTASEYVIEGDELALIAGVHMPLVIRGTPGGQYELTSPAFVYGMMSGERWTGDNLVEIALV